MLVDVSSLWQHRLRHPLIRFDSIYPVLALADTLRDNGRVYPAVGGGYIYQVKLVFLLLLILAALYRLSKADLRTLVFTFHFKYVFV